VAVRPEEEVSSAELLAPAGDFETALAAFEAGADAIYCGLSDFSARAFAKNFSFVDLENLIRYARARREGQREGQRSKVKGQTEEFSTVQPSTFNLQPGKVYVTFNTLLDEEQIDGAIETLARLEEIGPDGVIVQDLGVAKLVRDHFPGLPLHASTQLVAHNLEGVLALGELGFTRVVLARELSVEEIASIAKRCGDIELEVFIHGALCYSLSGLCLFGAMEKGRSGNRGKCPYCCRQKMEVKGAGEGGQLNLPSSFAGRSEKKSSDHCSPSPSTFTSLYPFSMKDLRLGEDVRKLVDAGVASLKIEGRMKSPLYVASVTKYYRQILGARSEVKGQRSDGGRSLVSVADLETVFSRRTTELYFNGRPDNSNLQNLKPSNDSPVDPESLGHLGTPIGVVKKVTKDREGKSWLRFHTSRGLEKHDGLQFEAMTDEGRHLGMGIVEMRQAISRRPVFEVNAGVDVEVLVNEEVERTLKPGMKIYCSMSNAVKRMFPTPSFRPSDYAGGTAIGLVVTLGKNGITAFAEAEGIPLLHCEVKIDCDLTAAKNPEKTLEGVKKAFSKLGETGYRLGKLTVNDPEKLFAPMSVLNDLRRDLVEQLDEARDKVRREKIEAAKEEGEEEGSTLSHAAGMPRPRLKTVKVRAGQKVPVGEWDEVIVAIGQETNSSELSTPNSQLSTARLRLATPVYTSEPEFNRLRSAVKRFLREGYGKWEASDLATLRMLKQLGVTDITADWTLYAFNARALAALSALGVRRFVASPENGRENLQYLAESGYDVEFLSQQSTPLFVSLTEPAGRMETGKWKTENELSIFRRDGLWVTTKPVPRTFDIPEGVSTRLDLCWDPA